jgi:hypothetical protein
MANGGPHQNSFMPLTSFQANIAGVLAGNRTPESQLAGGAALHIYPTALRFTNDLDYFQDSEELAATKANEDMAALRQRGYTVDVRLATGAFTRAIVSKGREATKVEWCYESNFRFFPAIRDKRVGFRLHPIDLAINKVNALANRQVPRDFVDVLFINRNYLSLGAMVWAASSRFPGMPPPFFLEQLARQTAVYGPETTADMQDAIASLKFTDAKQASDLPALRMEWNESMKAASKLIGWLPKSTIGCLFIDSKTGRIVTPRDEKHLSVLKTLQPQAGGVLPSVGESLLLAGNPAAKRAFEADYSLKDMPLVNAEELPKEHPPTKKNPIKKG